MTVHYKMEWIYMRTKVSGPERLELTLEMKKKIEKMHSFCKFRNSLFSNTCVSMDVWGLDR